MILTLPALLTPYRMMENDNSLIEKVTLSEEQVRNWVENGSKGATLVDVREESELHVGMIPGAIHIPTSTIVQSLHRFETGTPFILYCAHGIRSEDIACFLAQRGIEAYTMAGGFAVWNGAVSHKSE